MESTSLEARGPGHVSLQTQAACGLGQDGELEAKDERIEAVKLIAIMQHSNMITLKHCKTTLVKPCYNIAK